MSNGARRLRRLGSDFKVPLSCYSVEAAGAAIVRELQPDWALPTWQALRYVLMWVAEEPGERGDIFEPHTMSDWELELLEADWEAELRLPLAVLVGELGNRDQAIPAEVARLCLVVADWALEHGAIATALAFAEAAALAWPQSPRYAWTAGRLLRTHGRLVEAEQWLVRASRVAATVQDPESEALALNSLGNLYHEKEDHTRAAQVLAKALRTARKHHLRGREGEILHDLCIVAVWTRDLDNAERMARDAFEIYTVDHPRLPALIHDRAVVWVERGQFARALHVLRELLPFLEETHERAWAAATLARAAAACGDEAVFDQAWTQACALMQQSGWRGAAPACVELGTGASSLHRWDRAEQALRRAREIAMERGESDARAEAALAMVIDHRVAERERDPEDARTPPSNDGLAARFVAALRERRGGSPSPG
jgi:tetratricopeptide (TPR) repeat protein